MYALNTRETNQHRETLKGMIIIQLGKLYDEPYLGVEKKNLYKKYMN